MVTNIIWHRVAHTYLYSHTKGLLLSPSINTTVYLKSTFARIQNVSFLYQRTSLGPSLSINTDIKETLTRIQYNCTKSQPKVNKFLEGFSMPHSALDSSCFHLLSVFETSTLRQNNQKAPVGLK